MGRHRTSSVRRAATLTGAALTAGALLLAAPAATAFAAPGEPTDGGGDGGGTGGGSGLEGPGSGGGPGGGAVPGGPGGPTNSGSPGGLGVGNRPALKNPAPVLNGIQVVGDQVIGKNPALSGNPFVGGTYHTLFGAAGRADDGDGIREPGEAFQGAYVGVLNGGFQTNRGSSATAVPTCGQPGYTGNEPGCGPDA